MTPEFNQRIYCGGEGKAEEGKAEKLLSVYGQRIRGVTRSAFIAAMHSKLLAYDILFTQLTPA